MRVWNGGAEYLPILNSFLFDSHWLFFEAWWNTNVIKDGFGNTFSRQNLVLAVADQDGGAHADVRIDAAYNDLAKLNSMGWNITNATGEGELPGVERASLRHIVYEVSMALNKAWWIWTGNRGCSCGSGKKARYCCQRPS